MTANATASEQAVIAGIEQRLSLSQLRLLLGSVFIIAACSLLYELLISSLSTYLLGSSVIHYSLTIGLFLFFMGVGAWLANYIETDLIAHFVAIEITIGIVGGLSALLLYSTYAWSDAYYPVMIVVIAVISLLVGMEIPLLTRILESTEGLRKGISQVLAVDYLGALLASLLFPFVLLPYFGHLVSAGATGLLNLTIAAIVAWHFRAHLGRWTRWLALTTGAGFIVLLSGLFGSQAASNLLEQALYQDTVIHSEQSRYQKLVVTRWGEDIRLFLDGSLQFSSADEYRYHEVIAHLPAAFAKGRQRALIIGGGDGLAARELLRYEKLVELVVVDIDPAVSALTRNLPVLKTLSENSLDDSRLQLIHEDAWAWLAKAGNLFDLIVIDLPDPESEDTARLYTTAFYQRVARRLSAGGVMVTQATSPWFARRAFWSIGTTLEQVFNHVRPATVTVPSFGPWGFFLAAQHPLEAPLHDIYSGRFLDATSIDAVLNLEPDMQRVEVSINQMGSLPLMQYYREGWEFINTGNAVP